MAKKTPKKQSSNFSSSFVNIARRRKQQKIIFGILTVVLGVGLIGSSMFWAFGGSDNLPKTKAANVQPDVTVEEQIADLEAKLKDDAKNIKLLSQLAGLYRNSGQNQKSIDTYLKAIEIKPGDGELHKELGVTYFFIGDYDKATAQVQEALKIKPSDAYAHYYLGQFYAYRSDDGRDVAKGIAEMEEFVRLREDGPDVEKAKQYIEQLKADQNN